MQLIDLWPAKGFYHPDSPITLKVIIHTDKKYTAQLGYRVYEMETQISENTEEIDLLPGENTIEFTHPALPEGGYGISVCLINPDGETEGYRSTAFDVHQSWLDFPRYGFLSDFEVSRIDPDETIESLVRFHINGLQFYDWQYRHDALVPPTDDYTDPLGRPLSLKAVREMITAAHKRGIACMPYLAVYAASFVFWEEHRAWGMFDEKGEPLTFEDFLGLVDPSPESPWTEHLINECAKTLESLPFDGLHVDQYGDPKRAWNADGEEIDIPAAFKGFNETLKTRFPGAALTFNAVGNWPIEALATSPQDFVYIEVWEPTPRFDDLREIVENARRLSRNKPVVIPLYLHADTPENILLADAIIMASGGTRIEIGEKTRLLSDPYFPKHEAMDEALVNALRRYWDFVVRYQAILGASADTLSPRNISVNSEITPILRKHGNLFGLNLIRCDRKNKPEWTEKQPVKDPLQDVTVSLRLDQPVESVYVTSPDADNPGLKPLTYTEANGLIRITLPELHRWSLIVLKTREQHQ